MDFPQLASCSRDWSKFGQFISLLFGRTAFRNDSELPFVRIIPRLKYRNDRSNNNFNSGIHFQNVFRPRTGRINFPFIIRIRYAFRFYSGTDAVLMNCNTFGFDSGDAFHAHHICHCAQKNCKCVILINATLQFVTQLDQVEYSTTTNRKI